MKLLLRLAALLVPLAAFGQGTIPELHARLARGEQLDDAEWRRVLWNARALDVPRVWVDDQPLVVSMRVPPAIPGAVAVRARPRRAGLAPVRAGALRHALCGFAAAGQIEADRYQRLGRLPLGEHRVAFDFVVARGETWMEPESERALEQGVLWRGRLAFPVTIVDDVDLLAPPRHSDLAAAAIRAGTWAYHLGREQLPTELSIALRIGDDVPAEVCELGLSLDLALLRDGAVVTRMPFLARAAVFDPGAREAWVELRGPAAADLADERELDRYALRITGTGDLMPALSGYDARWAGSIELPLREALERRRGR